jgi:hypothetical protein
MSESPSDYSASYCRDQLNPMQVPLHAFVVLAFLRALEGSLSHQGSRPVEVWVNYADFMFVSLTTLRAGEGTSHLP